MRHDARRRAQRGSMVLVAAQFALVGILFMVVVLIIGRLAIQKEEQQNAVDAVNFAGAIIAKKEGLAAACDQRTMNQLVRANLDWRLQEGRAYEINCDPPVMVERDGVERLRFSARIASVFDNPFQYDDGNVIADPEVDRLRGRAISDIIQSKLSDVELPKVVFALDYSGSMAANYGDSTRIGVLREVVNRVLDLQLPVEFGLVLFNSGVFHTEAVIYDPDQNDIRVAVDSGAGGRTNYQAPLDRAAGLLRDRGAEKGYVIFIADGLPNEGGDSRDAAARVRNQNYSILSVFIGQPNDRQLLIDMGGSRDDPGNPDYYFEARDPAALAQALEDVFKTILCSMGPIEPAPDDAADLGLLLELQDQSEVPLPQVLNPRDLDDQNFYGVHYNPGDQHIKLSERACDDILFNNAKVVARHGSPVLLQ